MQLNTDHTKACLLKYFILDICQKVGFVSECAEEF